MERDAAANKATVRELTEHIWNRCSLDRIPEFYSPDYVADYRPYAPLREGHAGIRGMVERAWQAFPDYHEELHTLVGEGSIVVARFTISGTQSGQWGLLPPTGKQVSFDEILILELQDARVVRQSGLADNLTALGQLGVLPGQGL
jgi:predicted ester cyclase